MNRESSSMNNDNKRTEMMLHVHAVSYVVPQGEQALTILQDISFDWGVSTTRALIGVSGSGKSTLLHLLAGFLKPTSGSIIYDVGQRDDAACDSHRDVRTVGYVPQAALLIPELSVEENVMVPGLLSGEAYSACREKARQLLADVGLSHRAAHAPATLSGGEQQRVAIVRALWHQPRWLLMDEPTAHVDSQHKSLLIDLLWKLREKTGCGMLIATHDSEVAALMDERWVLQQGTIKKQE